MPVGNPEEHSTPVGRKIPDLEVARGGDERVVVVVRRVAERVIADIHLAAGLEQLDLVVVAERAELLYRLSDAHLVPAEGYVLLRQRPHAAFHRIYILRREGSAVTLVEGAEISFRNRPSQDDAAAGKHVLRGLYEQEAQRTAVGAAPAVGAVVEELDVPVVEHAELEPFADIVDLGGDYVVGALEVEFRKHLQKGGALLELLVGTGIPAIDPKHLE